MKEKNNSMIIIPDWECGENNKREMIGKFNNKMK